jgi:16S rRNA pseudouridine516 synthase
MKRLDALLADAAAISRSQARAAVRAGQVRVAGSIVRDPAAQVPTGATLELRGIELAPPRPRYLMLHKPAGFECSAKPGSHPSALRLVDDVARRPLHFAGRLDVDATGLVLLTDDGAWSHALSAPGRKVGKRYLVETAEPLGPAAVARLLDGIALRGEAGLAVAQSVELVSPTRCRLTITEGRYHQVKRMLAALGNRVCHLHREAIGSIELDLGLAPGAWRDLSPEEIAAADGQ